MEPLPKKPFSGQNSKKTQKRKRSFILSNRHSSKIKQIQQRKIQTKNTPNFSFRGKIINIFVNLYKRFELKFETLFLAIHILDKIQSFQNVQGMLKRSLSYFMIASKYQQVVPPSLSKITSYMKINIKYSQYCNLEFQTLKRMNFLIHVQYPTAIIKQKYKNVIQQKWLYFLLQLSLKNVDICWKYTWEQIVQGICLLIRGNLDQQNNTMDNQVKVISLLGIYIKKLCSQ